MMLLGVQTLIEFNHIAAWVMGKNLSAHVRNVLFTTELNTVLFQLASYLVHIFNQERKVLFF